MKKTGFGIIALLVTLIVVALFANATMFYNLTRRQADSVGKEQLQIISGRLTSTLNDAEVLLWKVASGTENYIEKGAINTHLKSYYKEWKTSSGMEECINVYAAGSDWLAFADFDLPSDYNPRERVWYKGAKELGAGNIFTTAPYIDAATGDMCFTVSVMLKDEETVVAVDFNLTGVQQVIEDTSDANGGDALIVTESGLIVGYKDSSIIGEKLSDKLPQYTKVLKKIINSKEDSMYFDEKIDDEKCSVFYSKTGNDWYLVSTVNSGMLYKGNYLRLFVYSIISLFVVIIVIGLYVSSQKSKRKAEDAFKVKEEFLSRMSSELKIPMNYIINHSDYDDLKSDDDPKDYMNHLREAAYDLDGKLSNLLSYTEIVGAEDDEKNKRETRQLVKDGFSRKNNRLVLVGIIAILSVAMIVSVFIASAVLTRWGNTRMEKEVNNYYNELNTWIVEQKSVLDMFASSIAANPSMLDDYEGMVKWLDSITKQYDDISVSYMTNPKFEHTVIMNNGWEPDPEWKVEQRQWYIDTISSKDKDGFSVSAPYYDEQTGLYCVTLSKRVYGFDGSFLGVFGVDFYLDKLVNIMNESYTDDGYAFLVDKNGKIINHPNKSFELSMDDSTSIEDAGYDNVLLADKPVTVSDYDGEQKAVLSTIDPVSNFSVVGVKDWNSIYGSILLYNLLILVVFIICVSGVVYLVNTLMSWQEKANETLKEAVLASERATSAKSQFLAQMSHEIRTPINAVLGMNEMIMRESEQENVNEYAENIQNAGKTLLALINSILDFSKIEDGKMEIIPVNYETASVINDMVNMISGRAEKKGLNFNLELDPKLPKAMYGDDVRIRQVITNILTNAVKYTDTGSVSFKMLVDSVDTEDITLYVEVKDTGIGIREEDMDKLFMSFQRLDEEKNRSVEGTGLGISIVSKLLQMMGSELKVESEYGSGSTFYFCLKQKIIDANELGDYKETLKLNEKAGSTKRILVAPEAKVLFIDDNNMNLMVAKGLLKRSKIQVDTALSGPDGIELVKNNHYDMIFLDHMMPNMDGIETLEELKKQELIGEDDVLVMMTANAVVGAREEYIEKGFDDYLSKPVDVNELEEMLAKYLPEEFVSYKEM